VLNFFNRRKWLAYLCILNGRNIKVNFAVLNPIVDDEPCYDENELKYTEVCPVRVVATVMRMKPREEETLLQDGSTETRDVELKHILFAHVNDHLKSDVFN
jgi:hypothetical protein